jgi:hypothetical protein
LQLDSKHTAEAGGTRVPQAPTLDEAFKALEQLKRGDDPAALAPIERAVREAHGNPAARAALEQRLAASLRRPFSDDAQRFACRELASIGSAASVPALAALVGSEPLSHMARFALERIPGPEADKALRDAAAKTTGNTRIGVVHSIGARGDARGIPLLAKMLTDDPAAAAAAARALGEIGTMEAAKILESFRPKATGALQMAVADAILVASDRLVASGDRAQAVKLLEPLTDASQAPHVRLAASRARSAAQRPR